MSHLEILGLTFNLYGLVLGIAILAGFQASLWLAKKRKFDQKVIEGLFWWVVIGGIIGARIYHVIDKWEEIYSLNPQSALYIWNGGLGILGALLGGVIGLYLGKRSLDYARDDKRIEIKLVELLDIAIFGVPLGQAIGRWGNYFNNEIVGKNGEPIFIYESILDLILFGILFWIARKDPSTTLRMTQPTASQLGGQARPGVVAGSYLIGYGLIRLVLETMRVSNDQWLVGNIPVATLISVISISIGLVTIFLKKSSGNTRIY